MSVFGIIVDYKRFAVHDGDGIRTTLFLKGCPLSCIWCHNPEGISFEPRLAYYKHKCINCGECTVCKNGAHIFTEAHEFMRENCKAYGACAEACLGEALTLCGRKVSAKEAAEALLIDKDFFAASGGGVTLSGGEPLMQSEFCAEIFRLVKEAGINTALDTCGYAPVSALETVLPYTDKVLFDIKAASSATHKKFTGKPNELIHDNLRYINRRRIPVEIRIPLIPGVNDGEIEDIAKLLAPLDAISAVRLLSYHGFSSAKYESLGLTYNGEHLVPPTKEQLMLAGSILESYGLKVILPD